MRIVLVGLVSLAATTLSFGQGTVNFLNTTLVTDPLHLTTPPDRLVRYGASAALLNVAYTNGIGVHSNGVGGLRAQLYQGNSLAVEGTLTAITTTPVTFRSSSSALKGVWFPPPGTSVPLADIAPGTNGTGKLQVRVWDSTYAPTYEAAIALGPAYAGLIGKSAVISYTAPDTNGTVAATDYNMTNLSSFTLTVPAQEGPAVIATNPTPTPQSLPVGNTGIVFSGAGAGAPPLTYQWYKAPSTLLPGKTTQNLSLSSLQLTDAGSYFFIVTGSGSATSALGQLIVTCPTIVLDDTASLANGTSGVAYSDTIGAGGGTGPYSFAVTGGSLAGSGLSLSAGGALSGTAVVPGVYNFTVTATDANLCTGSSNYSLTIDCATITITPPTLPNPAVGVPYSQAVSGNGGFGPYTFALSTNSPFGPLPTGLSLSNNGAISGTATVGGLYIYQIVATDTNGCTGTQNYTNTAGTTDGVPPYILKIDSPKATKVTDVTSATLTIASRAIDPAPASGIAQVQARVNGGSWTGGTASQVVPNITKYYFCTNVVTLATGTNTIELKAIDLSGTESTNVTFKVFLAVPVTVNLVKAGALDNTETLVLDSKTPSAGGPPNAPLCYISRQYLVDVAPSLTLNTLYSNIVYSGSESGPPSVLHTAVPTKQNQKGLKKIAFIVNTNTTLTANFNTNDFVASGGIYYGLFSEPTTAHESSGWFTVKVDSKQKFSGKLLREGGVVAFGGTFDLAGVGTPKPTKVIARKTAPTDPMTLSLQLNLATGMSLSGSLNSSNNGVAWSGPATMDANKSFNVAKSPIAPVASAQSAFALVMAGSTNAATQPGGDGYVFGAYDAAKNTLKTKGYAGDGYKISKTIITGLSTNGDWPCYAQLYKDAADSTLYHGALIGWLNINNGTVTGDVVWTKRSTAPGPAPYSGGFSNVHSSDDSSLVSSLAPAVPGGILGSGTVTIKDGNLASQITDTFTFDGASKFLASGVSSNGVKLKVKPTGEMTGSFDPVNKYKVFGIALQGSLRGVFTTGGTQSGSVRLTP